MPPISWTSKSRCPDSRLRASRTAANASKRSSSSVSPFSMPLLELGGLRAQLVVRERLELGLERGDVGGLLGEPLEAPALADAQDLLEATEALVGHGQRVASARRRDRRAHSPNGLLTAPSRDGNIIRSCAGSSSSAVARLARGCRRPPPRSSRPEGRVTNAAPVTALSVTHRSVVYAVGRTKTACGQVRLWDTGTRTSGRSASGRSSAARRDPSGGFGIAQVATLGTAGLLGDEHRRQHHGLPALDRDADAAGAAPPRLRVERDGRAARDRARRGHRRGRALRGGRHDHVCERRGRPPVPDDRGEPGAAPHLGQGSRRCARARRARRRQGRRTVEAPARVLRTDEYAPSSVRAIAFALVGPLVQVGTTVNVGPFASGTKVTLPDGRAAARLPAGPIVYRHGMQVRARAVATGDDALLRVMPLKPWQPMLFSTDSGLGLGEAARPSAGAPARRSETQSGATADLPARPDEARRRHDVGRVPRGPRRSSSGTPASVGSPSIRTVRSLPSQASSTRVSAGVVGEHDGLDPPGPDDPERRRRGAPRVRGTAAPARPPTRARHGSATASSTTIRPSSSTTNHVSSPARSGARPSRRRPTRGDGGARGSRPRPSAARDRAAAALVRSVRSACSISSTGTGSGGAAACARRRGSRTFLSRSRSTSRSSLSTSRSVAASNVAAASRPRRCGPFHVQLCLDDVVVGDPRVPLAIEDDLDEGRFVEALAELGELRLHVAANIVAHVSASHRDLQSHGASSSCCSLRTLPHRPGEANDLDRLRPRSPQGRRARRGRRPRRVDVVDEHDQSRRASTARANRPRTFVRRSARGKPGLPPDPAGAREQRRDRQPPAVAERAREARGRHVPSLPPALAVARDEREDLGVRPGDDLVDDGRERAREVAPAALLPRRDERPGTSRRRRSRPAPARTRASGRRIPRSAGPATRRGSRTARRRAARSGRGPRGTSRRAPPRGRRSRRSGSGARGRAGPCLRRVGAATTVTASCRVRAESCHSSTEAASISRRAGRDAPRGPRAP